MEEQIKLVGVVVDKYKTVTYSNNIKKDGFTVKQVVFGKKTDLIQVEVKASEVKKLGKLVQRLEKRYAFKNRHN